MTLTPVDSMVERALRFTPKKRIIFALLWQNGAFCLSRNFRLQAVGDLAWIKKHYNFEVIARSIDELIVLNVARGDKEKARFAEQLAALSRNCFVPLAAGGGIRTLEDAKRLLHSGADKLVVNTPIVDDPELVRRLAATYGRQCVVASIDYRKTSGRTEVYSRNGQCPIGRTVEEAVAIAEDLGAGEIYLTSMDKDGTGQGYDTALLERVEATASVPLIASGGVGNFEHLAAWLSRERSSAAATAHLFNFMGDGLAEARRHVAERGIPLASWDYGREN